MSGLYPKVAKGPKMELSSKFENLIPDWPILTLHLCQQTAQGMGFQVLGGGGVNQFPLSGRCKPVGSSIRTAGSGIFSLNLAPWWLSKNCVCRSTTRTDFKGPNILNCPKLANEAQPSPAHEGPRALHNLEF